MGLVRGNGNGTFLHPGPGTSQQWYLCFADDLDGLSDSCQARADTKMKPPHVPGNLDWLVDLAPS